MSVFNALQLAEDACGFWINEDKPDFIRGFAFDTRELQPGDLFLALKTEGCDGHDYLESAWRGGASGAIVEQVNLSVRLPQLKVANTLEAFHRMASIHRERFLGLVIGVTGSCGKTTTKDLLSHLLEKETHATLLNLNNLLGVPMTLMGLDNGLHKYGIVEAGINLKGEMKYLASMIKPDIAIITNIYPVHLEGLGSVDNIAIEKTVLAQNTKENGLVLFPSGCLQFQSFKCLGLRGRVLARYEEFVNFPDNQIIRYQINHSIDNSILISIKLSESLSDKVFIVPMISEGVVVNLALVISALLSIGINVEQIQERLYTWVPSKHRGQTYYYKNQVYYADCYNANPASMLDALAIFQKCFSDCNKHMYILGSMGELGDNAEGYHYDIGNSLKLRPQDKVIVLGTHAHHYELGIRNAGNDFSQIFCLQNKEKVFDYLEGFEGAVFLKGSNRYALWELLPEGAQLEKTRKDVAC